MEKQGAGMTANELRADMVRRNIKVSTTYLEVEACRRMIDRMIQGDERIVLLIEVEKKEKSLRGAGFKSKDF